MTVLWLGYWAAMTMATHLPIGDRLRGLPPNGDKALHFLMYFGLTMLGGRVMQLRPSGLSRTGLMIWAGIYIAFAALDEITQMLPFVGRRADLYDWVWDAAGVVLATALLGAVLRSTEASREDDVPAAGRE